MAASKDNIMTGYSKTAEKMISSASKVTDLDMYSCSAYNVTTVESTAQYRFSKQLWFRAIAQYESISNGLFASSLFTFELPPRTMFYLDTDGTLKTVNSAASIIGWEFKASWLFFKLQYRLIH